MKTVIIILAIVAILYFVLLQISKIATNWQTQVNRYCNQFIANINLYPEKSVEELVKEIIDLRYDKMSESKYSAQRIAWARKNSLMGILRSNEENGKIVTYDLLFLNLACLFIEDNSLVRVFGDYFNDVRKLENSFNKVALKLKNSNIAKYVTMNENEYSELAGIMSVIKEDKAYW